MLTKIKSIYLFLIFCGFAANTEAASSEVTDFKQTWVAHTLKMQREIDINAPLNEATFIGTHNSENSVAYQIPFVRYVDPNQQISIYNQLEMGVRSIELDVHWYADAHFSKDILLCHATSNHLGCSAFDKPVVEGLQELRDWLSMNPGEIVILYFDKTLDGHEPRLASYLEGYLGSFIYKPSVVRNDNATPKSCISLPATLSKADILKAGKQLVVITKYCDTDAYQEQDQYKADWNDTVFAGIGNIKEQPYTMLDSSLDEDFKPFPECSKHTTFNNDPLHSSVWRIFEDRTILSSIIKPTRKIYSDEVKELIRCGINWPTLDMLTMTDERLAAFVWSWAPNYPQNNNKACAIYKNGEGIENVACSQTVAAYACGNNITHELKAIVAAGSWQDGERMCQSIAGNTWHFATPINGEQMYSFKEATAALNLNEVWLNYRLESQGHWRANAVL